MDESTAAAVVTVRWRIVPLHTPYVVRWCGRCGTKARFASSDRFRINANGKRLDVWLIYRCVACATTWNLSLHERVSVQEIGAARHAAYQDNDRDTAWRCAFHVLAQTPPGIVVDADVAFRIEKSRLTPALPGTGIQTGDGAGGSGLDFAEPIRPLPPTAHRLPTGKFQVSPNCWGPSSHPELSKALPTTAYRLPPCHVDPTFLAPVIPAVQLCVQICLEWPLRIRLERVLAEGTGASRSQVRRWIESGVIEVRSGLRATCREVVRDRQEIGLGFQPWG